MAHIETTPELLTSRLPGMSKSPHGIAIMYCCLSLSSTITAACIEGLFIHKNTVNWNGVSYTIYPLLYNFSTLVDFALLNPIMIFYLLRALSRILLLPSGLNPRKASPSPIGWPTTLACMLLSVTLMAGYFIGFLRGRFFDAVIALAPDGRRLITVTGWLVFFWTSVAIYFLLIGVIGQLRYLRFVLRLRAIDVAYDPFHADDLAGMRELAEPALDFLKAMACLLAVFALFAIYDLVVFHINESDRLWALAVYAAVVIPFFFIPTHHLHRLMKARREELLARSLEPFKKRELSILQSNWTNPDSCKELLAEVAAFRELRTWFSTVPTWPLPTRTLIRAYVYFGGVLSPLLSKVVPFLWDAFKLTRHSGP